MRLAIIVGGISMFGFLQMFFVSWEFLECVLGLNPRFVSSASLSLCVFSENQGYQLKLSALVQSDSKASL